MKNFSILALVLTLAAPMAFAEEPEAPQPDPAPAAEPAPLSRFSLGTYLAFWNAKDVDNFDLDGFIGGGKWSHDPGRVAFGLAAIAGF